MQILVPANQSPGVKTQSYLFGGAANNRAGLADELGLTPW